MELWPDGPGEVPPDADGLLLHTNHFLSEPARFGDAGLIEGSTTVERLEALHFLLARRGGGLIEDEALAALSSHVAGVCCHPNPDLTDEPPYATLATIRLDLVHSTLAISAGRPCEVRPAAR
jgi:isopenicillin-N N-acyltransferase-like protein